MLKFYSASTSVVDKKHAVSECIEKAFYGETNYDCDLLIVYSAIGHNFRDLLDEGHRLCPSARLVGCTGAGVIGREGPNESMRALAVMAIRGPKNLFAATGRNDLRDSDYYRVSRAGFAGISDDRHIPGLKRMIDFVHRAGCRIVAQLNHGGLMSKPALSGNTPAGPSPLVTAEGIPGTGMTIEDVDSVVVQFAEAAKRSVLAGFDGVQVHAAHGFLLSQFLSPFFNKRKDEYGGTLENRARLLLRIISAVRHSIGTGKTLLVKINSDDLIPGGFSTGEMVKVAVMLENAGIDAIEISGGTASAFLMGDPENSPGPRLKKHVYYKDAAMAPLIREPDLISKWRSGNMKTSDCISEGACLFEGLQGRRVHCIHVQKL